MPAEYFLVTFTLPAQFRSMAWLHQRILYSLMIQCCWETLKTFSQNDKELHGIPGAIAVLHTHSGALDYHPHVHIVMPAAAIDRVERLWRTKTAPITAKNKNTKPYLFNPNSKQSIQVVQLRFKLDPNRALARMKKRAPIRGRCCGAVMEVIKTRIPPLLPSIVTVPT